MKFHFTLKLPTRSGGFGQILSAEHKTARSIEELCTVLNDDDFIVVHEFRVDPQTGDERDIGPTVLNRRVIGKVREFRAPRPRTDE